MKSKSIVGALLAFAFIVQAVPAFAYNYYWNRLNTPYAAYNPYLNPYANPYAASAVYNPYYRPSIFTTHPILSGTMVGGAVGALGGAAVGALNQGHQDIAPGAAIGAGTGAVVGAGLGMIRNQQLTGRLF